jgi:hypothetical protein
VVTLQQRAPRPRVDSQTATSEAAARVNVVVEMWERVRRTDLPTEVEMA